VPYTLAKFFLWGLLMALAGGVVGWLLRSLKCRGEVARARAVTIDGTELERLRGRVANLEPLVAERDRLRMELADVRGSSAGVLGFSPATESSIIPDDAGASDSGDERGGAADGGADPDAGIMNELAEEPGVALDIAGAASVVGKKIKLDDLTVVEGIGPKIAELCSGIGVTTWQGLAHTDVADLQSMLDAAGSRFQMHKPASWPQQAALLAHGKWAEFTELTRSLGGK
jgi:predicted flap endonuclease-1-like 5' DNA nuclease